MNEDIQQEKPNILLVVVDTLRADHLSCYGYHRKTSPFMDSIAESGVQFLRCFSQAPWTIPSFTTIMTGLYPEFHRIVGSPWNVPNANSIVLDDSIPLLAEQMLNAGYLTVAFDNLHQMASHPKWFVRGFNYYINLTPRSGLYHHHLRADETNNILLPWLASHKHSPFFAFVHYWEPHLPYNQPKQFRNLFPSRIDRATQLLSDGVEYVPFWGPKSQMSERVIQAIGDYDGEIRFLDENIERLFEALEREGLLDNTVVIITGDHGEAMVEKGIWFNHEDLFDPTIHVPLIISGPKRSFEPRKVSEFVELVDICPSILDICRVPTSVQHQGISLKPYLKGATKNLTHKRYVHSVQDGRKPCRMICSDDWKLIHRLPGLTPGGEREAIFELYNRKEDAFEVFNVSHQFPNVVSELTQEMDRWISTSLSREHQLDPLKDVSCSVDFYQSPGDPVLGEFYSWVGKLPTA